MGLLQFCMHYTVLNVRGEGEGEGEEEEGEDILYCDKFIELCES